mmetsp:Transcript_24730/g.97672  ORF Transcript_24730/g.97672 Transcript_24730/m.97672 type:complete len:222 (-) Transcript_24730:554-1219(-)
MNFFHLFSKLRIDKLACGVADHLAYSSGYPPIRWKDGSYPFFLMYTLLTSKPREAFVQGTQRVARYIAERRLESCKSGAYVVPDHLLPQIRAEIIGDLASTFQPHHSHLIFLLGGNLPAYLLKLIQQNKPELFTQSAGPFSKIDEPRQSSFIGKSIEPLQNPLDVSEKVRGRTNLDNILGFSSVFKLSYGRLQIYQVLQPFRCLNQVPPSTIQGLDVPGGI